MKRNILSILLVGSTVVIFGQNIHGKESYTTEQGKVIIRNDSLIVDFRKDLSFDIYDWEMSSHPQANSSVEVSYSEDKTKSFTIFRTAIGIVKTVVDIPPHKFVSNISNKDY